MRFLSKLAQHQPHFHSKARQISTTLLQNGRGLHFMDIFHICPPLRINCILCMSKTIIFSEVAFPLFHIADFCWIFFNFIFVDF